MLVKQPKGSVAARRAAFMWAVPHVSEPRTHARQRFARLRWMPIAACRARRVSAAKLSATKRTFDCSATRLAASVAAWLSSKHADASSHMAGSHAAPTCISHARHRTHWALAHSLSVQIVLKAVFPCCWPQLSRIATCACTHDGYDHTGVGQASHGCKGAATLRAWAAWPSSVDATRRRTRANLANAGVGSARHVAAAAGGETDRPAGASLWVPTTPSVVERQRLRQAGRLWLDARTDLVARTQRRGAHERAVHW